MLSETRESIEKNMLSSLGFVGDLSFSQQEIHFPMGNGGFGHHGRPWLQRMTTSAGGSVEGADGLAP